MKSFKYTYTNISLTTLSLVPFVADAQTFAGIAKVIVELLNEGVKFLIILALVGFVWGLVRFVYNAGDERTRTQGKQLMIWGTLALFFMVSVWGIVRIIKATFLSV